MYPIDLSGKNALVMGVANHRSLSWAIAQHLSQAGARLALTYAGERLKSMVEELAANVPGALVLECDVTRDDTIDAVAKRLESEWGVSEANQRAKYYKLTAAGKAQLPREQDRWSQLVHAIGRIMNPAPANKD